MGIKDLLNELIVDPCIDKLGKAAGRSDAEIARDRVVRAEADLQQKKYEAARKQRAAEAKAAQAEYEYVRSATKGMSVEQRREWKKQNGLGHVPEVPEIGQ